MVINALSPVPEPTTQEKFLGFVERNPACLLRSSFSSLDDTAALIQYQLQSWPTFLDPDDVRELERASLGLARLVKQIPHRVLGLDPGEIARLYRVGTEKAEEAVAVLRGVDGLSDSLMRVDMIRDAVGWKCLEVNCTSNLGGWRTSLFAGDYLGNPWIRRFLEEEGLEVSFRNCLHALLSHMVRTSRRRVRDGAPECNIAVMTGTPVPEPQRAFFNGEYQAVLRQEDAALAGEIFTCGYVDLALDGSRLFHDGKRIHVVLEQHEGYVSPGALASWLAGEAMVFNGPASRLLSDKRNLALLSQELDGQRLDAGERLDEGERALIAAHVPWTRVVQPGRTRFRGEPADMAGLLSGRREDLVLKTARGARGEGVQVGCFTAPARWDEAVAEALAAGDRVVQEYVEPLPAEYQLGSEGSAPHEVVWGVFVLGDTPGGGFLRMMPGGGDGVINAERGATEGLFFEVVR